ncbi:MAG: hypothetical protein AB7S44_01735 [Spirochaetales bacterium]
MKNQKKLTAIVTSVAMLAITAMATTTATFAWFTRGTQATASGFDFTASAASGIQVSTDALTWKSSITTTDFDLTAGQPQENSRLSIASMEPVSTIDGTADLTDGEFDFYTATSGDGNFTISADHTNYLVFDLYFLNQGADALTLSLTNASAVTDGVNDQDASLSTRVGFVVEGSNNDPTTATGLAGGSSTYIWEPNSTTHSASALAAGVTASAKYEYHGLYDNNGGVPVTDIDYYGHLTANASYTTIVDTTHDLEIGDSGVVTVLPGAGSGQITKVKVFVWMEGQDVDSNNAASTGDVAIELAFDSGADATQLGDKTADTLTSLAGTTTLAVTGAGDLSVTYSAYVFQTVTDTNISVDYRLYLATGSATYAVTDVTEITLDNDIAATPGTYNVVVVGKLTGSISSRTATDVIVA